MKLRKEFKTRIQAETYLQTRPAELQGMGFDLSGKENYNFEIKEENNKFVIYRSKKNP